MSNTRTKSAFIALVGMPNVGKSSLMNKIIGTKVAIVSDKPQTTRTRIMGVYTREELQLVFLDTPGVHRPRTRLGDYMVKSIGEAVSGVDTAVLVIEPSAIIKEPAKELLEQMAKSKLPVILAVNKIDTLPDKAALLACIDAWQSRYGFTAIIPLSALTGEGVDVLMGELNKFAFDSPHFFPDDMISDQPERVLAAEIVREKLLLSLRDEIPHGIAVVIERMSERETTAGSAILDMEAYIYCERESHKGMVIGKRGAMLKQVGSAARVELESLLGAKINLQCWVKVKEDWRNRQGLMSGFGYRNK